MHLKGHVKLGFMKERKKERKKEKMLKNNRPVLNPNGHPWKWKIPT